MTNTRLYGLPRSSYVWSAEIALLEKDMPYDFVALSMGEHRLPAHLARHPFAKVPAFEHDGFALYETQAILRYVDQVGKGPSLQPSEPRAAARMNQMIGVVDAYFMPSVGPNLIAPRLFGFAPTGRPKEETIPEAIPRVQVCLAEFARLLGDRPFLAGDQLSLADIAVFPLVHYLSLTPERSLLEAHPRLMGWRERLAARPSAVKSLRLEPRPG